MTVKDVMDEIKSAKKYSELLYALADKESEETRRDDFFETSEMLERYVNMLESMKVQGFGKITT
jgi:hypothetical protein